MADPSIGITNLYIWLSMAVAVTVLSRFPINMFTIFLSLVAAFMGARSFTGLGAAFIRSFTGLGAAIIKFGTLTGLDFFFVLREGLAVFSFSESLDSDESDNIRGMVLLHIVFCGCCTVLECSALLFMAKGETLT